MNLPHGVYVAEYVRRLEGALIGICADLGLPTTRVPGRAGIWVTGGGRPDRKVAVVGTRVQQRVTMHGFALNCSVDLRAFDAIVPCGITDTGVTSLSARLDRQVTVDEAATIAETHLSRALAWSSEGWTIETATRAEGLVRTAEEQVLVNHPALRLPWRTANAR